MNSYVKGRIIRIFTMRRKGREKAEEVNDAGFCQGL